MRTLARVAVTSASQGRTEDAIELLAEAERMALLTCGDAQDDKAIVGIVQALASIGDFDRAHTVASSIKDGECHVRALPVLCIDFDSDRRARAIGRLLQLAPWHVSARELIRMYPSILIRRELAASPGAGSVEHRPVSIR